MKYTLLFTPPRTYGLIYGAWLLPGLPSVVLAHGTTTGENWFPVPPVSPRYVTPVYYNDECKAFSIGKRLHGGSAPAVGKINYIKYV